MPSVDLCAHCRVIVRHWGQAKMENRRWYCSQQCLVDHYKSLSYPGAVHKVHQMFGPEHPVTKQIQKMHEELKLYHRIVDVDRRRLRGKYYFEKYLEKSNKCL